MLPPARSMPSSSIAPRWSNEFNIWNTVDRGRSGSHQNNLFGYMIMKIVIYILAVVQIAIGLLFIVEAPSTQRLMLGTISFGLGSICLGIAVIIGQLDAIRFNRS